jgi:hypothetical protein
LRCSLCSTQDVHELGNYLQGKEKMLATSHVVRESKTLGPKLRRGQKQRAEWTNSSINCSRLLWEQHWGDHLHYFLAAPFDTSGGTASKEQLLVDGIADEASDDVSGFSESP